jgi:serine/threonine protein phosphatase 1
LAAGADLTEGRRIYAVGDIHGRLDLLAEMLARIRDDLAARPHPHPLLVFLGDYVDRGPDSRGVIEALMALEATGLPTAFLLGNHDSYVQAYLEDPDWSDRPLHWLHPTMGGAATLVSYGVTGAHEDGPRATHSAFRDAFPADHEGFLDRCRLWLQVGGYVFAHAGIRPGVEMAAQERDDLIWIREPFLSSTEDFGFKVVHGHTIVPRVQHHPNRIAIDTGAVRHGLLSCVVLEGDSVALLTDDGPRPLPLGAGLGPVGGFLERLARR